MIYAEPLNISRRPLSLLGDTIAGCACDDCQKRPDHGAPLPKRYALSDGENHGQRPARNEKPSPCSPTLCNYQTGEPIRPATTEEANASREAAGIDGGCGVIEVDGARCYVED